MRTSAVADDGAFTVATVAAPAQDAKVVALVRAQRDASDDGRGQGAEQ